jgi:DnaA family protein
MRAFYRNRARDASRRTPMKQLALDLAAAPPPTLDNFFAGRNAELVARLRELAAGAAGERFVYLWGPPGSGRTHLLRAAAAEFERAGARALYVACASAFVLPAGLERADCALLDDVERLDARAQEALFHVCNGLRERAGALIASGPAPPLELGLREDLATRLGWGLVYRVHALTDEERALALAEHAARRGFRLPPEVADYLLQRLERGLPSLLAALDALDRYSLETRRPVTLALARELLRAGGARAAER